MCKCPCVCVCVCVCVCCNVQGKVYGEHEREYTGRIKTFDYMSYLCMYQVCVCVCVCVCMCVLYVQKFTVSMSESIQVE